ncbi:DUF4251 domain-containing protein [Aquimarina brevivitae]|uniref:Uncharacterized protein DUF4251 n=1 Tax=Aquimarina brevivitae TaxID=323412 RepID=A0A4Q7P250_9FLAO|nr:DUF4251 domain-containing protein [Aquimarina brevivitae]RZS93825.1 uncharacterized protein DUF4251 [Aquimarina brevivitae]
MDMKKVLYYFILGAICVSCSSTKQTVDSATAAKIQTLVTSDRWTVESDWAFPLTTSSINIMYNAGLIPPGSTGNRINLIGNTNYFTKVGDSISVYMPFFGDRQLGGGYNNTSSAITFEGAPKRYEVKRNEKKAVTTIETAFTSKTESYNAILRIYDSGITEIIIYGSHRSSMRYTGRINKLKEQAVTSLQ